MGELASVAAAHTLVIEIGGVPVLVRTDSVEFLRMLEGRYSGFLASACDLFASWMLSWYRPGRAAMMMSLCACRADAG